MYLLPSPPDYISRNGLPFRDLDEALHPALRRPRRRSLASYLSVAHRTYLVSKSFTYRSTPGYMFTVYQPSCAQEPFQLCTACAMHLTVGCIFVRYLVSFFWSSSLVVETTNGKRRDKNQYLRAPT
ncbi:hypothetical protein PMIN06_003216 [Paraphaeosphaeria minitans]